jgi:hypothetical protein
MTTNGAGEPNSFANRHPVGYAAKVAVACTAIMMLAEVAGAWLDDEPLSLTQVLRYASIVFAMFFVAASGFLVAAKRRGELK